MSSGELPEWDLWPWWIREGCERDSFARGRKNKLLFEDERRETISSGESNPARPRFVISCWSPRDTTRQKLCGWSIRIGQTSILCLRQRLDFETESLPVGEVHGWISSADSSMPVAGHRTLHVDRKDTPPSRTWWQSKMATIQLTMEALCRSVSRVDTKNNTADLFTKHLDGLRARALAKKLGLRFLDVADDGTNGNDRWWQLSAFNKRLQLSRGVSSFSFQMWHIEHYLDIDICTLTPSLPCRCLPCCLFFFFSLSTNSTWIEQALSFILSLRKHERSSHCHLDNIQKTFKK